MILFLLIEALELRLSPCCFRHLLDMILNTDHGTTFGGRVVKSVIFRVFWGQFFLFISDTFAHKYFAYKLMRTHKITSVLVV